MVSLLDSYYATTSSLFLTTIVLILAYIFIKWQNQKRYFKQLNIAPGPTPWPLAGNLFQMLSGLLYFDIMLMDKYAKNKRIVGYFEGSDPVVLCNDPHLIKNVAIKDFCYFTNKRNFELTKLEPFDKWLTTLKDDEWKNVRSIVTTTFTSGKLKAMSKILIDCTNVIIKYVDETVASDNYFDARYVFGSYTLDTINSCCFGVQTDALNNPDSEFLKHIKEIFATEISPKMALMFFFPKLSRILSEYGFISFFPVTSARYLSSVVDGIIERRKSKKEYREDFIQIMVDHEHKENKKELNTEDEESLSNWKSTKKSLSTKEILSQAILFLSAGSETTATTLSFIAYNLALNQDCQKTLLSEIDEAFEKHGSLSYDMVNDVPYLDMVISETLRLYPGAIRLERMTGTDYEYNGVKIPKGTVFGVAVYSLHRDPEFYPDPEKFIPERFSPDVRKQRESNGTYMPFGIGPRNCVGMRFATLEIKIIICAILSKYEFHVCDKTPLTFKYINSGVLKPIEPIILKLKRRSI